MFLFSAPSFLLKLISVTANELNNDEADLLYGSSYLMIECILSY
jgi:hypothetical protein